MKILYKNGLPYSICVLFAPGVVILPIELDLRDFFEFFIMGKPEFKKVALGHQRGVVWFIERAWAACGRSIKCSTILQPAMGKNSYLQ